jgi:hypothetical protein
MTCDCPDPVVFGHGCQPTIMTTIMTTAEAAAKIRDLCQKIQGQR